MDVPPFQPSAEGDAETSSNDDMYRLQRAEVVQVHEEVYKLVFDIEVLYELVACQDELDHSYWEILNGLSAALDALDLGDIPGTASAAREVLRPFLERPALADAHRISAVGHAHLDSAWLWPIAETKRKFNRTMANVVRLIEDGSDLIFAMPAAQHVAWLEQEDPELFARVKACVADGSIVPVGAMWAEPDAMLPGGEALCRQLLEGVTYFEKAFGYECKEIWLPDSFGYSAALPQIAREAGIDRFLTQKISWNQTNRFPHHTLLWEGLDGSRIFTHFPPSDTYGSDISGSQIKHSVDNFKEQGQTNCSLLPFGYGDGGGGPTRDMLEKIDRPGDLQGSPRLVLESPHDFFDRAQADYPEPPVWVGELYLELHRGTLTSQIAAKQGNRRSEALLRETELWCATAAVRGLIDYPYEELQAAWHKVLLCQFHDILPGTSIAWVYREVAALYADVEATCSALIDTALSALAPVADDDRDTSEPDTAEHAQSAEEREFWTNASSFTQSGVRALGAGPAEVQTINDGELHASEHELSNGILTLRFADGLCTSLRDVDGVEYVPFSQKAGEFHVHQDFPNMWDAWDIDQFYRGSLTPLSMDVVDYGIDGYAFVRAKAAFGESHMDIEWRLLPGKDSVDVHVSADWHEQEKLLKVAFPVDIHTDRAQYETQLGYLERPTHTKTSWEDAKFEVSAHRWMRVANDSASMSIANDSTYGWEVTRHPGERRGTWSQVRATLVKSARFPDPNQDQGSFAWNFRIHPAASVLDATADGQQLNLLSHRVGAAIEPLVSVDGAVVESVALDAGGDVIVRLYEATGGPKRVTLSCPEASDIEAVDLCYRPTATGPEIERDGTGFRFELSPFQLATLKLTIEGDRA